MESGNVKYVMKIIFKNKIKMHLGISIKILRRY
jgi:hypothetical protein